MKVKFKSTQKRNKNKKYYECISYLSCLNIYWKGASPCEFGLVPVCEQNF